MNEPWELSCYTANLVAYLAPEAPAVIEDFADAVRLSVRTDPPEGGTAFAHHTRVDIGADGHGLAYRGATGWTDTRTALEAELRRHGRVLAIGNTRHIPWSPSHEQGETPHWLLIHGHADGKWSVRDDFEALTPHGEQTPWAGLLDDEELRRLLTPLSLLTPEAANRDRYALGRPVDLPDPAGHRWLERAALPPQPDDGALEGIWVHGTVPVLRHVADRICPDPAALDRHADDLWTAARHQRFLLAARPQEPEATAEAVAAWGELPRAIRFALASAERGRPRPALVEKALARVIDAAGRLEPQGEHHDA
ncbi:hypothetical protein [Streptomyces sp. ISL-11]|uniref:hypothetical protein n=1 Tax=Streptomyces sp. ISL-11 TaxID=2819174 RepID=UPI001BE56BDD|nr:hypothetical protein [Streptomyces sp. ISL-11]MBT2383215.1 hypothetical protein [Streptomyces sp. ISL-11]